jgi:DNA repair protein SbcC/Rad50
MVPIRLQLRNFLSYGDNPPQEIDLQGVHMAALVGNNGAGKSALLDAITWALFGEARSNRNEQLLRQGANEMSVTFEFEVEGQIYRVRRRFSRRNKSHTATLEQQVDGKKWRSIVTESKVRLVGEEIQRLLRMDYDTFVNTVFMPQGRSGEFMSLDPSERRDLLAQLLGLEAYEELAEKAREQFKTLSGQISEGEKQLRDIEIELSQRPQIVLEFERKQQEREHMAQMLAQIDEEIAHVQKKRENLLAVKAQLEQLKSQKQTIQRQIETDRKDLSDFERQRQQWQKVLSQEAQIVEEWRKFLQVQQTEEILSEKLKRLRELEQKRHQLEQIILRAKAELENKLRTNERDAANIEQRLAELKRLIARRSEVERQLEELRKAREMLRDWEWKQRQWQNLQQERMVLEQEIASERAEWAQREGQLLQEQKQLEAKTALKPQIEQRLRQLEEAREKLSEWQRQLDSARKKREQISGELNMLNTRWEQLRKAREETEEKLHLLEGHSGEPRCPLCETVLTPQKVASLKRKLTNELKQREAEISETEQEMKNLKDALGQVDNFISQAEKALQKLPEIEQQFGEFNRRLSEIAEAERNLEMLRGEWDLLRQQKAEAEERWQRKRSALDERERAIGYDTAAHQQCQRKVEALTRFEAELEQIQRAEEELALHQERLERLKTEIAELSRKLSTNDFAHDERSQLEQVNESISNLGYDEKQHQQLRAWLQKNQHIPQWWQQLQIAREEAPKIQARIEQKKQQIGENEKRLSEIEAQEREQQAQLAQLPEIEEQLNELLGRRKARENELQRLNEEVGALRYKLEELSRKEQEKSQLEQRLAQMREEKMDYELLAEAFGRNGIPKMILRHAVPWLEDEASRLLARLTQGRMRLRFALETQTQQGTQREDLKIFVSDELGDRPYELYSGGEKFRIDFAVRVALARLLAHRAGAPLRTLIIDEGFGSQDREGLEAIVDAIQTVSKEFDRVLIVTHLDELRDYFPALIEVTKGSNGSQCRLIIQDQQEVFDAQS